jgi:hypothetical protein
VLFCLHFLQGVYSFLIFLHIKHEFHHVSSRMTSTFAKKNLLYFFVINLRSKASPSLLPETYLLPPLLSVGATNQEPQRIPKPAPRTRKPA